MSIKIVVALIMLVIVILIAAIDIYLLVYLPGNTFSALIRLWATIWPPLKLVIAFAMGLLCGHWFW